MKPAFSTSGEAAGFVLLLAVLLALPALLAGINWGNRRELYASIPNSYGPYPWIERKLFTEAADADIVFLGSSHIWYGIDAPYVQMKLSQQLNRDAAVFTLGWNWAGYDMLYVIVRDLLNQRRVRTIVIHDEHAKRDIYNFHRSFRYWYRFGETPEMVSALPLSARLRLYGIAVTGVPRQLLNCVRANRIPLSPAETVNMRDSDRAYWHMDDLAETLGSACCRGQMTANGAMIASTPFQPLLAATTADVLVYPEKAGTTFSLTDEVVPPYQLHFARLLAQLCRERGTQIVFMHMPTFAERADATLTERKPMVETLGARVVGIPGAKLFSGLPTDEVRKLFVDPTHLNDNGRQMFTELITPTLFSLHANPH